ncbi:MAG: ferric reductase-like transmembrane domain-containing protein [Paracoccaceae bacterium]
MSKLFHPYWLWAALSLPAIYLLWSVSPSTDPASLQRAIMPTGQIAVQLLILAMSVGPLSRLRPDWRAPRWFLRHRRYIGLASAGYALLHAGLYLAEKADFLAILREAGWPHLLFGWLALALLGPVALTSSDLAKRLLGENWRVLHRLVYLAAFFVFAHWAAIWGLRGVVAILLNFSPLIILTFWRGWVLSQSATEMAALDVSPRSPAEMTEGRQGGTYVDLEKN